MDYYNIDLKGHKILKNLPKIWDTADVDKPINEMFVLDDFGNYAKRMYGCLNGIKKFYEKEFNEDNTNTIDEYIGLFYSIIKKINKLLLNELSALKSCS